MPITGNRLRDAAAPACGELRVGPSEWAPPAARPLAWIYTIIYTTMETSCEWDPEKNEENLLERRDDRFDYGEVRMAAIGVVDGIEMTVYYTDRGQRRRLFSARKATRDERQAYYHAIYP